MVSDSALGIRQYEPGDFDACRALWAELTLVGTAIDESRARGLASVKVRPVARNATALEFFHSAGFSTIGQIELFMLLGDETRSWRSGIELAGRDWTF